MLRIWNIYSNKEKWMWAFLVRRWVSLKRIIRICNVWRNWLFRKKNNKSLTARNTRTNWSPLSVADILKKKRNRPPRNKWWVARDKQRWWTPPIEQLTAIGTRRTVRPELRPLANTPGLTTILMMHLLANSTERYQWRIENITKIKFNYI